MTDEQKDEVPYLLWRSLKRLTIATVILYLVLIAGGIKVYVDSKNTTDTLCIIRDDFQQRVDTSFRFLKDHPKGVPGFPPGVILKWGNQQQQTLNALNHLNCSSK